MNRIKLASKVKTASASRTSLASHFIAPGTLRTPFRVGEMVYALGNTIDGKTYWTRVKFVRYVRKNGKHSDRCVVVSSGVSVILHHCDLLSVADSRKTR